MRVARSLIPLLLVIGSAANITATGLDDPDLTVSSSTRFAAGRSDECRELTISSPIERDLQATDEHCYQVYAEAGQYFRVVVLQESIDVAVKLLDPSGAEIVDVDSPNARTGPEPISAIALTGGRYQLRVRSLESTAPAGRYKISLVELHSPTDSDRQRINAERLLVQAERLRAKRTAESLRQALALHQKALPILRAIGDRWKEAETLNAMGYVYFSLSDIPAAVKINEQALELQRLVGDREGALATLNTLGTGYKYLGKDEEALKYFEESLQQSRELKDRRREAYNLRDIGNVWAPLDRRKAYEILNESLVLAREQKDRYLQSDLLTFLGSLYVRYGEPHLALPYFDEAIQLEREVGDKWMEGRTVLAVANAYWWLRDQQKALESYERGLELTRLSGSRVEEAEALGSISMIYAELHDAKRSLEYADQALALARTLGIRREELYALGRKAAAHRQLEEPLKALECLDTALATAVPNDDKAERARLLNQRAAVEQQLGNRVGALSNLEEARKISISINDKVGEAYCLSEVGAIYSSLGKPQAGLPALEQALSIQRAGADRSGEFTTLYRLAKLEHELQHHEIARTHIENALSIVDGIRRKLFDEDLRNSWWASTRAYYELYIDILMEMHDREPRAGYDALALQVSERSRARSFLETLNESHAQVQQGVDPELLRAEQTVQRQLNAKADSLVRLLNAKHSSEQERDARRDVDDLLTRYKQIEAKIRAESPRYAALTQPSALSSQAIQEKLLDDQTALLEYSLGETRSYAFVVTKAGMSSYKLPKRADIEAIARRSYELLSNKADAAYPDVLANLSRMILAPLMEKLRDKRLLIVADGALQYIPFGALPNPDFLTGSIARGYEPLLKSHEIVNLPSASVLAVQRQLFGDRAPAAKKLIVFADPVFATDDRRIPIAQSRNGGQHSHMATPPQVRPRDSSLTRAADDVSIAEFKRLPMSRVEADLISARVPKGLARKLVDFDANVGTATAPDLSKYQIVHFATHSLLNNRHPELSGIVLSLVNDQGQPQDGFLRLNEIYNLQLGADLVVLSACQTALGKEINGEGLVGLTRGFMYAGAPRVVASVWKVDDRATTELMKLFYNNMLDKKMRPPAALRAAQISLMEKKQWRAPYYWAGFVLEGESN